MASSLLASQSLTLKHPSLLTIPKPKPLLFSISPLKKPTISASSSSSSSSSTQTLTPIQSTPLLTGSTRTLTTLAAVSFAAAKALAHHILNLGFQLNLQRLVLHSAGPAFFAASKSQPVGLLNTPLTLVAAGLAKWLDIYSGVLMVRVLLSWFPNIPWERQPLSAIRDLCDPYLNLFRNIIPPIFDTLDVSPLLAFAVLGTLGSILNSSRGSY